MSTEDSAAQESAATTRTIESGRLTKALTEPMRIEAHAPGMYAITNDEGTTRTVDIEGGACECADAQYRGDEFVCKHVLRAAVVHAFTSEPNTQLVARVLAEVRERGCIHDTHGCNGPTRLTDGGTIPCPDCVDIAPGLWTAWCCLTGNDDRLHQFDDDGVDTGEGVATDGGTDALAVRCTECDEHYELTTETGNDCPACGVVAFETIDDPEVATDGGTAATDNDSGYNHTPSIEARANTRAVAWRNRRLKDRIESVAGERPAEVHDGRRRVTVRFERIDEDMMAALSEAFDVQSAGISKRETIRGDERTVARYDVLYLDSVDVEVRE